MRTALLIANVRRATALLGGSRETAATTPKMRDMGVHIAALGKMVTIS
jgi:hypothetical protein